MANNNLKEILRISQVNHSTLVKRLNSNKGKTLAGKWVAVAKNKLFTDSNSRKVLNKAKNLEPSREKILLVKVPNKNMLSVRF